MCSSHCPLGQHSLDCRSVDTSLELKDFTGNIRDSTDRKVSTGLQRHPGLSSVCIIPYLLWYHLAKLNVCIILYWIMWKYNSIIALEHLKQQAKYDFPHLPLYVTWPLGSRWVLTCIPISSQSFFILLHSLRPPIIWLYYWAIFLFTPSLRNTKFSQKFWNYHLKFQFPSLCCECTCLPWQHIDVIFSLTNSTPVASYTLYEGLWA